MSHEMTTEQRLLAVARIFHAGGRKLLEDLDRGIERRCRRCNSPLSLEGGHLLCECPEYRIAMREDVA